MPVTQTLSAAVTHTETRSSVVPVPATADQALPFQCRRVPCLPTAQASLALSAQTPTRASLVALGFGDRRSRRSEESCLRFRRPRCRLVRCPNLNQVFVGAARERCPPRSIPVRHGAARPDRPDVVGSTAPNAQGILVIPVPLTVDQVIPAVGGWCPASRPPRHLRAPSPTARSRSVASSLSRAVHNRRGRHGWRGNRWARPGLCRPEWRCSRLPAGQQPAGESPMTDRAWGRWRHRSERNRRSSSCRTRRRQSICRTPRWDGRGTRWCRAGKASMWRTRTLVGGRTRHSWVKAENGILYSTQVFGYRRRGRSV